jgi:hypothetical protein
VSERRLPPELLDAPVAGVNLMPGSLRDQMGDAATLLVFLRHFGCVFCRETLADLSAASAADPGFPPTLLFFQGSATEGRALLRREWPSLRAVSDPQLRFYEGFGIDRMGWLDLLRPGLRSAARRARERGIEQGERSGDIWRLPGVFLVRGDRVLWSHPFRHAGDRPDWERIGPLARALSDADPGR